MKWREFSKNKLFQSLGKSTQDFIKNKGHTYRFTIQELTQITEMAADFGMWRESIISEYWEKAERKFVLNNPTEKKSILCSIKKEWVRLKDTATKYETTAPKVRSVPRKITDHTNGNEVFGLCPVASEKTVCCNLHTIDAVQGCGLGCSYCSIQTFYEDGAIGIETNLKEKLASIQLDPTKNYHIGSGQSSDSLAMGNRNGILDAQLNFAKNHPNIIFEFKTKTKNIDHFLPRKLPKNIFVCWTLNPQIIIDHEEHFTASLNQRITAARQLADKGVIVGFHFHPIMYYEGYEKGYTTIVKSLLSTFSPMEVGMVSLGTLTFIKPAIKSLRSLGIPSKVLQIPMEDASGKYSYPLKTKEKIFSTVLNAFTPWHNKVFFYFCMEDKKLWESVIGTCYKSNDEFEKALFSSVSEKMNFSL